MGLDGGLVVAAVYCIVDDGVGAADTQGGWGGAACGPGPTASS